MKNIKHAFTEKTRQTKVRIAGTVLQNVTSTDKDVNAPAGITVIGGKTGTTGKAGHCLIVLCKDSAGNPYISCVMGTTDTDTLYEHQKMLMNLILNG